MYIVTNRNLQPDGPPTERFGETFNEKGPNELRLAEAKKVGRNWKVAILDDEVEHNGEAMWASEFAFLTLQERMRDKGKNALFFVHGYNVDFKSALETGWKLQQLYNMEVGIFTWPSNGGGIRGLASYKSDKRDAILSVNALDRCFEKLGAYMQKHRDTACNENFNLAMHSMGNYLFKFLMKSSVYQGETLLFDNIAMLAADVNNHDHAEWIDRATFRKRLYITINENDHALFASRLKFGDQQLARLGHWTQNLSSRNAVYLDFTQAAGVGNSHSYFMDGAVSKNSRLKRVFADIFNGRRGEDGLDYNPHSRMFLVR